MRQARENGDADFEGKGHPVYTFAHRCKPGSAVRFFPVCSRVFLFRKF